MENGFELLDPSNARAFLKRFSAEDKRNGNSCYQRGCVGDFEVDEPGVSYDTSVVEGNEHFGVDLTYDGVDGWRGHCTCGFERCHHQYAAMRALLAEHGTAVVRNLSSSKPAAMQNAAASTREVEAGLARRLTSALGRVPNAIESKFIKRVSTAYARSRQTGTITYWDFEEMGLRLGGYGWDAVKIWPAAPANEHEFWLYVARAAQERNVPIPEFMLPITDFKPIEERLKRWRRSIEIEKWEKSLAQLPVDTASTRTGRGETDLRLMVYPMAANLQWLRPGHELFEDIKQSQVHQIAQDETRGWVQFKSEAALLWHLLSPSFFYSGNASLVLHHADARTAFGRVLRTPVLEGRIVNRQGQVLKRPAEPLRWAMAAAENENDDYKLTLVDAEAKPVGEVFCVLPGKPALYVTEEAVYAGPAETVLDPTRENRIPAPVIERAAGVSFLEALGLPLPARVSRRVRKVPIRITIHCELRMPYPGGRNEDCIFTVRAESPEGHKEFWNGNAWQRVAEPVALRKAPKDKDEIVIHDRSLMGVVPSLLASLDLKRGTGPYELYLRVTRRFPEIFSEWLKSAPPEISVELHGELASFMERDVAGKVSLNVTETEIDWFDLRVVLDVSDTTLSQPEIKLLLKARGSFVRLAGKGWRRLQYDLSDEENERLARLGLSASELSDEPQKLHALQLADEAARKFLPERQVEQIRRRASEIKARVAPPVPENIKADLRPYQIEGFHFLAYLSANRFGGILADDMGLGKTLQALAWLAWLQVDARPNPSLVVCPKSVMDNWRAEAERFVPGFRVKLWPAAELNEFHKRLSEADLHVLNYNQLRGLAETILPLKWQAIILDEGQYIKNPSSQTAQLARQLQSPHRLILSGTPIENRLMDLWSLMAFAMPGVLGTRGQFLKIYDAKGDPFARRRLASRVRPFLLRRTKAQVAKDLPDRIEEDLFCEIEGEQKTLYRAELKRAQQILLGVKTQKELAKQQFHFLTSLLRLRQICCHPKLVNPQSGAVGAKAEALLEQLEPLMEEGNKVLVFSQFVELLNLLRPMIEERGWPIFYLAGDTENRGELVSRFQAAEGPGVFLISLKAGGFGLNLTAASYVVLFDPWWNPAVENQAIDRTHRIGQANKVIAYRLLIKDSIEEKIRALQKTKSALAQDVLGEERFAQSLTLDDLRFLLAD
jgi:hypothetical protein